VLVSTQLDTIYLFWYKFCIFYTSYCLKMFHINKYSLKVMFIIIVLLFFCPTKIPEKWAIVSDNLY